MSNAKGVNIKLEVVVIPVSDVDRAKEFYQRLGLRSTPILPPLTAGAWSSSRRRLPAVRSSSERT